MSVSRRLRNIVGMFSLLTGMTCAYASSQCDAAVLASLGWRFQTAPIDAPQIQAGAPCTRSDLADAQVHGDLHVRLPSAGLTPAQRDTLLAQLLQHPATVCAYAFELGDATRRAADALSANPGFRFSALQLGWIGFGAGGARADGWEPLASFGRAFRPAGSNRAAIEAFYSGSVRAECGVGRQIAQYAAQAELYGDAGFDQEFSADELVIGRFTQLHRSDSILLGAHAGTFTHDGGAQLASRLGRQGFAGLPGFIVHVLDRSTLDDINNQAENFVVYAVSADTAAALHAHNGFAHYNRTSHALWELSRSINARAWHGGFERALFHRDMALRARLAPRIQRTLARMDALLDDPFYRGFEIYVHRQGVKPVGFHLVRLLDRNPRTPFRIELTLHNLHTTLFHRYIDFRRRECEAGGDR